jgi:hypothetical protein
MRLKKDFIAHFGFHYISFQPQPFHCHPLSDEVGFSLPGADNGRWISVV